MVKGKNFTEFVNFGGVMLALLYMFFTLEIIFMNLKTSFVRLYLLMILWAFCDWKCLVMNTKDILLLKNLGVLVFKTYEVNSFDEFCIVEML